MITHDKISMYAIFLDIETTGLDPFQHRPVDLAFQIVDLQSELVVEKYQEIIYQPVDVWKLHDPVSIQINGYSYETVKKGKKEELVCQEVIRLFNDYEIKRGQGFFICQNPAFDRAFFDHIIPVYTQEELNWPYHWLDLASMYWVLYLKECKSDGKMLPNVINLSKNAIGKRFGIPEESQPHRAMNGVEHLIRCYQAVTSAFSE